MARKIVDSEVAARAAKTERLRAARVARDATENVRSPHQEEAARSRGNTSSEAKLFDINMLVGVGGLEASASG